MTTPSGWTPPTSWPTTKQSSARNHQGFAGEYSHNYLSLSSLYGLGLVHTLPAIWLIVYYQSMHSPGVLLESNSIATIIIILGKDTPAPSSTTTRIEDEAPRSTSTDRLRVPRSRRRTSGGTRSTATRETPASTVTPGRSSSSTPRSTSPPSVTTSRTPATVLAEHSVPLHTLNVSVVFAQLFVQIFFLPSVTILLNLMHSNNNFSSSVNNITFFTWRQLILIYLQHVHCIPAPCNASNRSFEIKCEAWPEI